MTTALTFDQAHDHERCRSAALARAEEICTASGARLTPIRRKVLELVWLSHRPIGAYAILERLSVKDGAIAPPTVYRALDFLLAQGLIHKLESLNAYMGCDRPQDRHISQFLICSRCNGAIELTDHSIASAMRKSAAEAGFSVSRLTVELEGICAACERGV